MIPFRILILCSVLILLQGSAKAQDPTKVGGDNEIKLNLIYGVFESLEFHYERILNDDMGIGVSAAYFFSEADDLKFMGLPYFRFYPSEKSRAEGFFIEANTGVVVTEEWDYDYSSQGNFKEENITSFGFGVALGGKFISRSGIFGEVYGGLGRIFGDNSSLEVYPRAGINLGYRF